MKVDRKLRKQLSSIERKFSIDPNLLAKANRISSRDIGQYGILEQTLETKYKKHKIAERSVLSALDQVHLDYLSKQRKIMIASEKAIENITNQEIELQGRLDSLKEAELDKIQPDIDRFLHQSKVLKKVYNGKHSSHRKMHKFIDGQGIISQINELQRILAKFDYKVEAFCDRMNQISGKVKTYQISSGLQKQVQKKQIQIQTVEQLVAKPTQIENTFSNKLKSIRESLLNNKQSQEIHDQRSEEKLDFTKEIITSKIEEKIEAIHFHNVSIGQIFDQESQNMRPSQQIEDISPVVQYKSVKQSEVELQSDYSKYQRMKSQPKFLPRRSYDSIDFNTNNFEEENKSEVTVEKQTYQPELRGLKSVRSEDSLLANRSTLSQKSSTSRGKNCLEMLRMQKMKYEETRNEFLNS